MAAKAPPEVAVPPQEQLEVPPQGKTEAPPQEKTEALLQEHAAHAEADQAEGKQKSKAVTLYVGDLDPEVTEKDLIETFKEYLSQSVHLCRDRDTGDSLCYAYVNFQRPSHAQKAMACLNHSRLKRKFMRIMWFQKDSAPRKTGLGNVFVKNLHPKITNAVLQGLFCTYGMILSCKVAEENGRSKCFGFVQFKSEESATNAINALNDTIVEGKKLYVSRFVRKSERAPASEEHKLTSLYVKNLAQDVSEEHLREKFAEFGEVSSVAIMKDSEGNSKGFGFVNFKSLENVENAIAALNGAELGTQKLYVGLVQKKAERDKPPLPEHRKLICNLKSRDSNLYVKNLDKSVDEDQLRDLFCTYGKITSAIVMRGVNGISKGFGFVCFSTPEEATKAIAYLNGAKFHGKQLYVAKAEKKEERHRVLQNRYSQSVYPSQCNSGVKPVHPFHFDIPHQPVMYKHAKTNIHMTGPSTAQYYEQYSNYIPSGKQTRKWDSNGPFSGQQSIAQANFGLHNTMPTYGCFPFYSESKTSKNLKSASGNLLPPFVENIQAENVAKLKGKALLDSLNSMAVRADPAVQVLHDENAWTSESTGVALHKPASCFLY